MKRLYGFSLLEIMLALVVVGIGMSVVMAFFSTNQQHTGGQAIGNDYSTIVTEALKRFTDDVAVCNTSATSATCPVNSSIQGKKVYDYICQNSTDSSSAPQGCTNGKISTDQYNKLKDMGVDLLATTVSIGASKSDV
ncbi:MAG: prepilin-type N-terminal cleavage/methylation domain-containing protein [Gammaproteobacteria bacterium]|nr:prepilin-type N-terminal cleavage/methylation domain-containing protein [Gammaproteobacteria bacterium]MCD8525560.1 prepilin-type N-terminal cleavage/methylation domain-containing protein [Gammaproteobacteria bacterium]MCD8542266.1 prepilin-type N-terminal cleavage/methylation domain-containing protein [Gammaproteobacteria bacterium]